MSDLRRPSRRKHHIIYKTTCLVTGRYYLGMHSTDDLQDGYLGSGVHLTRSVKKHGKDQHVSEVLEHLPCRETLKKREEELVTEDLVKHDVLCMNLIKGGGGSDRDYGVTEKTRKLLSEAMKAHHLSEAGIATKQRLSEFHTGKKRSPETGAKIAAKQREHYAKNVVTRSEESKQRTSATLAGKPKPSETVDRMKAACTGRRKTWRADGTWFWKKTE